MLTKLFVSRPTLATVLVALSTLIGVLAAITLRVQELPNVDLPIAAIIVFYPAASPVEMRDSIVRPLEDHLAGAPGLDHIQSRIQQGFAQIIVQFGLRTNRTNDLVEIQRRVGDAQSAFPADLQTPIIEPFDPGQAPVVELAVTSSSLSPGDLSARIRDRIIPAIEQLPDVGGVNEKPIVAPAVEVQVDPAKLDRNGIAINDVIGAIAGNNVHAPGGILYGAATETGINIRGDIAGAADVGNLPIPIPAALPSLATLSAPQPAAPAYRVGDVASVANGHTLQRIYAYTAGRPIFLLTVQKATNASEVNAAQAVIAAIPGLEREFGGIKFTVLNDRSAFTGNQVRGVERTLLESIFLVALVMIVFLRSWRNAVSVLIAIPTSLLITLIVMRVGQLTLDTVSLLAMTLITGILVDDSIVVLENVQRHRDVGEAPAKAAVDGRLEIGLAAIVITLVDVVVFLPIAFLPGIVGRFLSEFAIVVVVATLSSLLISFTITPALAANWSLLSLRRGTRWFDGFNRGFERLRAWYSDRILPWSLHHPWVIAAIAVVTVAGAAMLVPLGVVGFEFVPPQDTGEIFMQLDYPGGTPLTKTRSAIRAIEDRINALPDVDSEITLAGAALSPVGGYLIDGAVGQVDVHFRGRRHNTPYLVRQLRDIGERLAPAAHPVVIPVENVQNGNAQPIDYLVSNGSGDPAAAAKTVYDALARTPGAVNVYSSAGGTMPQLNVHFDRKKARQLNVSVGATAMAIRAAFGGLRATQFATADGLKDVEVTYPPRYQHDLSQIKGIPVRTDSGTIVHVGDFASFAVSTSPRVIDRVDRQTVIHVSANVAKGSSLSNVQSAFAKKLETLPLPAGALVGPNTSGDQQNLKDTVGGMKIAIVLGMILVFLLMVSLYNSYLSPFIIMFSVPLAVVGALGALALTRETLNAFSLIGTVLLIGLVSKNGILLVDFANRLHAEGIDRIAAIREAARTRFRPILMTTVAMVFGMLPLALGLDPAVAARRSLGLVVIGGLTSSLLLTLVVIPVIYVWLVRERPLAAAAVSKRASAAL